MRGGALRPTPGVHYGAIEHDASCSIFCGRGCDCVPDITLTGPDGVIVVDEHGVGRKMVRS
jgi:hypothetical protein